MRKETIETSGRRKNSKTKNSARTLRSRAMTPAKAKTKTSPRAKAKTAKPSRSRGKPGATASTRGTSGSAKTTTDHKAIQRWTESRGGKPASVKGTERSSQHAGLLRIDFPGFSGAGKLIPISWKEWFQKFDQSKLAFLFQEKTKDGKQSRFFKLVKR